MNHALRSLLSTTCLTAFCVWAFVGSAQANPEDGVVSAGQASIAPNGKNLNIYQQTQKAVIDWRAFDINSDETTSFYQPNSSSIILNRVHSSSASQINGNLNANGHVVIVNQNGIVFGAGSQVDVHGLVASTADIDNDHFMNDDKLYFNKAGQAGASIINNGSITAKDAGLVGFVAPNVENNGIITAKLGRVHLASGSTATVDFYGDGLMEVQVGDDVQSQVVSNTGSITADGGVVALTAAAGGHIVHSLINSSGSIRAQSVGMKNGEIIISAAGSNAVAGNVAANKGKKQGTSKVVVSGSLDASGKQAGETGGKIVATGDEVVLNGTASVDASGYLGGGLINLGGDYQGSGDTPNALFLTVNHGAVINNRAIYTGNGGRTILWSDGETVFEGDIIATGGILSGDGGFTEVSGHDGLNYNGLADLSAANGSFGTLLLDPTDITISSAASSAISYSAGTYTGTGATSNLNVGVLQTQLGSASVIVNTASAYAGNGDITVANAISWSSANNLTLTANRDIVINAAITSTGASTITANATRNLTYNANVTTAGAGGIVGTATNNLTVASGAILSSGSTGLVNLRAAAGVITNTGLLTLNGKVNVGTGALTLLSGLNGTARNNLTLDNTTFAMQGASVGAVSLTGFYDVNFNKALTSSATVTAAAYNDLNVNSALTSGAGVTMTLTAAHDMAFNANTTASASGAITATATNNLTVASGATVATSGTGGLVLRAANGTSTNTGLLTLNGKVSVGTGNLTLLSGLNGTNRNDLTLDSTTYSQGASVGTLTLTGFNNINLNTAITSSVALTLVALNDLTVNAALTGGSNSAISLTASRDLLVNANVTAAGTGNLTGLAARNLTIASGATVSSGATGGTSLRAANGTSTNTGLLTLNGKISTGTGALTLLSGLDTSSARTDLTLNSTNYSQGANVGTITFTGFNNINLNTAITSSVAVTLAALNDLTVNAALTAANNTTVTLSASRDILLNANVSTTGSGGISGLATRNLTLASGATVSSGATGLVNLRSAAGTITNQGLLTLNGTISVGTGTLTLLSGLNGTARNSLTLDNTTFLMQGATVAATSLTGFYDINFNKALISSAAVTATSTNDISVNAALTSGTNATVTLTAAHDIGFNANVTAAGSGGVAATATNNLTVAAGKVVTAGATGAINLRSAGGVNTSTGLLYLNGMISAGTGSVTLLSGVDTSGNRNNLTLDSTTYLMQGASVGAVSFTGFNNINLNSALTSSGAITIVAYNDVAVNTAVTGGNNSGISLTASHDALLNANVSTSGSGSVSALATNNLTVASGVTVASGATGGVSLRAANGTATNTGLLTINGKVSNGTNVLSLVSGLNGAARTNLTLDSASFLMLGANIAAITITGFNDINLNTAIASTGAFSATAYHDLNFNSNLTLTGTTNITGLAVNNLTVASGATLTSGSTGGINLRAANGVITNTGLLTLDGKLITGSSSFGFTLLSGVNGTNRTDLNLSSATYGQQGGGSHGIFINGFRDVTINTNMSSNSNNFQVVAQRNLTVASGTTLKTNAGFTVTLRAAGGTNTNTGLLNFGGIIDLTNNSGLIFSSGVDASGNRGDIAFDSSNFIQEGTIINNFQLSGFRDITLNHDIISNQPVTVVAQRNLTIGSGVTVQTGSTTTLQAAGGVITNTGLFNMNGKIIAGSGVLTLTSGVDSSNNRSDLTLNSSNYSQGATVINANITGFRDINVNTGMTSASGSINIIAERNLAIGSGAAFETGSGYATVLKAAGGNINNIGLLTFDGKMTFKLNSGVVMASGVDSSGGRADLTLDSSNYLMTGATTNTMNISGFRDVNLNRNITLSSQAINVVAQRNLTIGSGAIMQAGTGAATTLQAAGGVSTNTGVLALNGKINTGTGSLTLTSGLDASGNAADLTLDSSNYSQGASVGLVSLSGFRDVVLNSDMTATTGLYLNASRDLTVGSGVTLTSAGETQLRASSNDTNKVGHLNLNGKIVAGTGNLLISSGVDTLGNRANLTLDSSNYAQGSSIGLFSIAGFNDINLNTNITSVSASGVNVTAQRNLTLGTGVTLQGSSNMNLYAAGGVITNSGVLTLNGKLSTGNGILGLISGVNGTTRSDLTLNATNYIQPTNVNQVVITGFRDINLDTNLISRNNVTITAERNLSVANGIIVQSGTASSLILKAAGGITTNVGLLNLNGLASAGTGDLTLVSGVDVSGSRADINLNSSNLTFQQPEVGKVSVGGFRNITVNTTINSNASIFSNAAQDMIIGSNGYLSSVTGTTLIAGHNFINNRGAGALSSAAGGRWVVYSTDPKQNSAGNLPYSFRVFSCAYGGACAVPSAGNGFVYTTFDYDGISASIPATVIRPIQTPQIDYVFGSPTYSSSNTGVSNDGGFVDVASIDQVSNNDPSLNSRAILIIVPELAKRFDLENWDF